LIPVFFEESSLINGESLSWWPEEWFVVWKEWLYVSNRGVYITSLEENTWTTRRYVPRISRETRSCAWDWTWEVRRLVDGEGWLAGDEKCHKQIRTFLAIDLDEQLFENIKKWQFERMGHFPSFLSFLASLFLFRVI
jgi:hypothetical protein